MSELKTAIETVLVDNSCWTHPIPQINDLMGKYWSQPNRFEIEIDDNHALMSKENFDRLAEYSCSVPTGVYPGKMWKRRVFFLKRYEAHPNDTFLLVWFGNHPDPKFVTNNYRKILIV